MGIITAPGISQTNVSRLMEELPEMLNYYVSEKEEWALEFYEDALTGGTTNSMEVLEESWKRKKEQEWDFVIAVTDLPLFHNKKTIVAEVFRKENAAHFSLPALGFAPRYKRMREAILQLMNEIYYGSTESDRHKAEKRLQSKGNRYDELKNKDAEELVGNRIFELISPLEREVPEDDRSTDVRFTAKSRLGGLVRLLSGMVYANRPWEFFPAFTKILIIAFTTGSYAIIFPTVWQMSTYYSASRGILVTIATILALVVWVILSNGLWERKGTTNGSFLRKLYNSTTFLTLLVTVIMYYFILFIMFSTAVLILVPPGQVEYNISTSPNVGHYLLVSWIGTSIATIIGAIGSAFEDKEVILNSTYGHRQQRRYRMIQQQKESEENY